MQTSVVMQDIYTGDDGVTALTLRFSFVSPEKTLSKQELMPTISAVSEALRAQGLEIKA